MKDQGTIRREGDLHIVEVKGDTYAAAQHGVERHRTSGATRNVNRVELGSLDEGVAAVSFVDLGDDLLKC
mgnify:CR=1 FL=1